MPLVELDKKGSWIKVSDLDGVTHWAPAAALTNRFQCLAIKVNQATLRIGPGYDQPPAELPSVGKYAAFKRIEFDPPWYLVEDEDRDVFWVHEKQVWKPLKVQSLTY